MGIVIEGRLSTGRPAFPAAFLIFYPLPPGTESYCGSTCQPSSEHSSFFLRNSHAPSVFLVHMRLDRTQLPACFNPPPWQSNNFTLWIESSRGLNENVRNVSGN